MPGARNRIEKSHFGKLPGGADVCLFNLSNIHGMTCKVMAHGAAIAELQVPDREGKLADVVLGYPLLTDYLKQDGYMGATIGRVANRIAAARFLLDGCIHQLSANDGVNHLHGGICGFDKVLWIAEPQADDTSETLTFRYCSQDGEEGYPGTLSATVAYTLTDDNELIIQYGATTDKPTPVNLTNHTYFNLSGEANILNHRLNLEADHYMPLDKFHIPTREIASVSGTAADFRSPTQLGTRINQFSDGSRGLNYSYVLNQSRATPSLAARLHDPESGRVLELITDQPSIQLYTGSYLKSPPKGKGGRVYGPNSGLCLEAQWFPDAVNFNQFPPFILYPGKKYQHRTIWKFSTD